jgi:hypothetical protein
VVRFLVLATLGAVGCGLISSDVASLIFDLPMKTYSLDSASFGSFPANTPAIPCGTGTLVADCCNPPAPLPNPQCSAQRSAACEGSPTKVCALHQQVTIVQKMDFRKDVAQLMGVSQNHLANLTLQELNYAVTQNTLNVAVPTLHLYLAPATVTTLPSAEAVEFGTVDMIPAGQMPTGSVVKASDADATFETFASDLTVPFNLLVGTTVVVPSGQPTPSGKLSVTITGKLKTKLAL